MFSKNDKKRENIQKRNFEIFFFLPNVFVACIGFKEMEIFMAVHLQFFDSLRDVSVVF